MKAITVILTLCATILATCAAPPAIVKQDANNTRAGPATVVLFRGHNYESDSIVITVPEGGHVDLTPLGWDGWNGGGYWSIIPVYGYCFHFTYAPDEWSAFNLQYDSVYNPHLSGYWFVAPPYISATVGDCQN